MATAAAEFNERRATPFTAETQDPTVSPSSISISAFVTIAPLLQNKVANKTIAATQD
jgi:hypothetical protein